MEINNCEDYVLSELHFAKEKIKEYELIIENQKEELNRVVGEKESSTTVNIDRSSGIFYSYIVSKYYNMEELLKLYFDDDFTLDEARTLLNDSSKLKELMQTKRNSWSNENKLREENYQILLTYAGREYVVCISEEDCSMHLLNDERYYHEDKKSLAETNMIAKFKENLKKYIESEEKKLEEKKDGSK